MALASFFVFHRPQPFFHARARFQSRWLLECRRLRSFDRKLMSYHGSRGRSLRPTLEASDCLGARGFLYAIG